MEAPSEVLFETTIDHHHDISLEWRICEEGIVDHDINSLSLTLNDFMSLRLFVAQCVGVPGKSVCNNLS